MRKIIGKISFFRNISPAAITLTTVFVSVILVLFIFLWLQILKIDKIEHPVVQIMQSIPGLASIPQKNTREVLIINSYHNGYSWSDNELTGIVETLLRHDIRVQPLIEYLDCKHFPKMEHFDRLCDLFEMKYGSRNIPVVIAADNPAFEFALKYRPRLFPRAAIVFCGVNGYSPKMIEGLKNVTGVAEILDVDRTIELALKFHPYIRKVVVIHDYSITGLATRRETEVQLRQFNDRLDIRYLENMSTRELMNQLRGLSSGTIVLALSYSLDRDGQVINHEKISRLLGENSPVPVYGLHEERLGYGIVGGSLLGGRRQGARAAEMAAQVLTGKPVADIPVDDRSPTRTMFDYIQLVRFGIPVSAVPDGSIIVNRPVSFFAQHPGLVLITLAIISILAGGVIVLGVNIYRRRLAEREQLRLQTQLVQAQKMEAVGHLAGGIAHDFNNILTAIIGYANMLQMCVQHDEKLTSYADQILSASDRAATLTRSLLAFSRKQVIEPKTVDLNDIVQGIVKITKQLIGEDIDFKTIITGRDLIVLADSGKIEQVLLNLCTNARDAMPQGGRLTIETGMIDVDESYRKLNFLEKTGRYGIISVSDTGTGMDEFTRRQIFEPFYTTKEVGKGTGLGLSIVYGIVKQHNGTINVYSEPGKGTTFRILLPMTTVPGQVKVKKKSIKPAGGNETILLAEDDNEVRVLITMILQNAGYSVIVSVDGDDAVKKFRENQGKIQLLLSDVIMPKKNGKETYENIRELRPDIKVLFMSGYTADVIQSRGVIADGLPFISKPIIPDQLLQKIRGVLDS